MEVEGTTTTNDTTILEPLKDPTTTNVESTPTTLGGFDCNICLDMASDPVVTLCGHLYCWPCIYKWLHLESPSSSSIQNCPVCKASLTQDSLVPLYGRGKKNTDQSDLPSRPRLVTPQHTEAENNGNVSRQRHHHHYHVHHHHPRYENNEFVSAPSSPLGGTGGRVIGGMAIAVLPRMFGDRREVAGVPLMRDTRFGGTDRMRRHEKEVQRSLHQIWVFLSCCALLCLFLF